jgi:hypothetical protein
MGEYKVNLSEDFWKDDYVRSLNPKGKLALAYIVSFYKEGMDVSIEDMAKGCGLEYSEANEWFNLFNRLGVIARKEGDV